MPKKNRNKIGINDFTIKDFADSKFSSFRPKKSTTNTMNPTQEAMLLNNDDRNWDDSEDELDFVRSNSESFVFKKSVKETTGLPGNVYPLALWFLISENILPEDVGTFAAICKSSYYTTTYAKFWNDFYKRHCKPFSSRLPKQLQPECVTRRHGLRSFVIRSLYYTYSPLADKAPSNQMCTPEQLLKCRCASVWFKRVKDRWSMCFKMALWNYPMRKPTKNLMDLLDDIHANSQEGHRILEVICSSFTDCTSAMGMILTVIKASIGVNMSSHRLTLGFSSAVHAQPSFTVMLDNVVRTQVHDWWQTKYPHPGEVLPTSTKACPNKFNSSIDAVES